jgi:hypothetical protein
MVQDDCFSSSVLAHSLTKHKHSISLFYSSQTKEKKSVCSTSLSLWSFSCMNIIIVHERHYALLSLEKISVCKIDLYKNLYKMAI